MPNIDESSFAIGKIEGNIESILKEQKKQSRQIDNIERAVTNLKVKTARLAGVVSVITTVIVLLAKSLL